MTRNCPCCGGTGTVEDLPAFSRQRHHRIYLAVAEAAADGAGISRFELAARMYSVDDPPTESCLGQLRTHICDMNKSLLSRNQRIIGRDSLYYLDSRENENAKWESEKAWKTTQETAASTDHGDGRTASRS